MNKNLKVAIVHDYLHEYGGAEGVVQAIWEMFPNADIYSATYDKEKMNNAGAFIGAKVFAPQWRSNLTGLFGNFVHKMLIANLPFYFYFLDLSKYDLIISSTAHFAKGIRTRHKDQNGLKKQIHISYIHTPPRFLYGFPGETRKRSYWYLKPIFWPLDTFLRVVDQQIAKWPDYLICNSETVKARIKKFYNRDATVINPFPVVDTVGIKVIDGDYFITVNRLVKYKNVDLCINTCGKNGLKLKVVGSGSSEEYLKSLAIQYKTVEMVGFMAKKAKYDLIAGCKAMICAVEKEDFGMVPLEANAFGKPVVALRDSGYLETVVEGKTGVFFDHLTEESMLKAIKKLEKTEFDPKFIKNHAKKYSKERFKEELSEHIGKVLK